MDIGYHTFLPNLEHGSQISANVCCINHAGESSSAVSPNSTVDLLPPVFEKKPKIGLVSVNRTSVDNCTTIDSSYVKVSWEASDGESGIESVFVRVFTKHSGTNEVTKQEVQPRESSIILPLRGQLLHRGDRYYTAVRVCDQAGLCTLSSSSEPITVDPDVPYHGNFSNPNFSHNGSATILNAFWSNFVEEDSHIASYAVSIGDSAKGNNIFERIISSDDPTVVLNMVLAPAQLLYLSVYAINHGGLHSQLVEAEAVAQYQSSAQGSLILVEHGCTSYSCEGDCACPGRCLPAVTRQCHQQESLPSHKSPDLFSVTGGNITYSSKCVNYVLVKVANGQRYQFQIVFEAAKATPNHNLWMDEIQMDVSHVYCLHGSDELIHGEMYVLLQRVWLSTANFAILQSESLLIDRTPPELQRRKFVVDVTRGSSEDVEYSSTLDIGCDWSGVFQDRESIINRYELHIGSALYRSDVKIANLGRQTQYFVSGKIKPKLHNGVRYYFSVTAYNNVGLYTTASSDGVTIDTQPPRPGTMILSREKILPRYINGKKSHTVEATEYHDLESAVQDFAFMLHTVNTGSSVLLHAGISSSFHFDSSDLVEKVDYFFTLNVTDVAGNVYVDTSDLFQVDKSSPTLTFCTGTIANQDVQILNTSDLNGTLSGTGCIVPLNGSINVNTSPVHHASLTTIEISQPYPCHRFILEFNDQEIIVSRSMLVVISENSCSFRFPSHKLKDFKIQSFETELIISSLKQWSCSTAKTEKFIIMKSEEKLYASLNAMDSESDISAMFVWFGTSVGGHQYTSRMSVFSHVSFWEVNMGEVTYASIKVLNKAGQESIFHSNVLNFSSPLVIDNMDITSTPINDTVLLEVMVTLNDMPTDVQLRGCYQTVELPGKAALHTRHIKLESKRVQFSHVVRAKHEDIIKIQVECFDSRGMKAIKLKMFTIDIHEPHTNSTSVHIVPNYGGAYVTSNACFPPNTRSVQIQYSALPNSMLITSQSVMIDDYDWIELDFLGGESTLMLYGEQFPSLKNHTVSLRLNTNLRTSDSILTTFVVSNHTIGLTTHEPTLVWASSEVLQLSYSNIFSTDSPAVDLLYEISVGLKPNIYNLVKLVSTNGTNVKFPGSTAYKRVYYTITGILNSGFHRTANGAIDVPSP